MHVFAARGLRGRNRCCALLWPRQLPQLRSASGSRQMMITHVISGIHRPLPIAGVDEAQGGHYLATLAMRPPLAAPSPVRVRLGLLLTLAGFSLLQSAAPRPRRRFQRGLLRAAHPGSFSAQTGTQAIHCPFDKALVRQSYGHNVLEWSDHIYEFVERAATYADAARLCGDKGGVVVQPCSPYQQVWCGLDVANPLSPTHLRSAFGPRRSRLLDHVRYPLECREGGTNPAALCVHSTHWRSTFSAPHATTSTSPGGMPEGCPRDALLGSTSCVSAARASTQPVPQPRPGCTIPQRCTQCACMSRPLRATWLPYSSHRQHSSRCVPLQPRPHVRTQVSPGGPHCAALPAACVELRGRCDELPAVAVAAGPAEGAAA